MPWAQQRFLWQFWYSALEVGGVKTSGVSVVKVQSFIMMLCFIGPPRMSPKSQRTPRAHRVPSCRGAPGVEFMSQGASGEASTTPPARSSPSGGTWSSVVSGGKVYECDSSLMCINQLYR